MSRIWWHLGFSCWGWFLPRSLHIPIPQGQPRSHAQLSRQAGFREGLGLVPLAASWWGVQGTLTVPPREETVPTAPQNTHTQHPVFVPVPGRSRVTISGRMDKLHRTLLVLKKEIVICATIWENLVTQGQILHDSTLMRFPGFSTKQKVEWQLLI